MLDTDACIALIKNRPESMRNRLVNLSTEEVGVSAIVTAELWFGVQHSQRRRQNEAALKDFLSYATVLDWIVWKNSFRAPEARPSNWRNGSAHRRARGFFGCSARDK